MWIDWSFWTMDIDTLSPMKFNQTNIGGNPFYCSNYQIFCELFLLLRFIFHPFLSLSVSHSFIDFINCFSHLFLIYIVWFSIQYMLNKHKTFKRLQKSSFWMQKTVNVKGKESEKDLQSVSFLCDNTTVNRQ